ncbi:phage terminase large subunit [Paenimyroides baculatum]|uniref:Phage terminase large subunit N-terminal domain-containing protein n=1 Tax=Paenimyroides baculatum TaxID=2608000 RepID=A0A5M6CH52_9FLAO|nr:phage terminase large subunit [Paenimyroides baculatum]KAA5534316.1 hypothetical protein F0460_09415 [Paenimyroides baculatum]
MSKKDEKKKQFLITPKQKLALNYMQDSTTSEILLSGSAGSAKSIIAQFWGLKMCLKYEGFRLAIVRKNITDTLNTVIKSLDEVMELQNIPASVYKFDRGTSTLKFENGSEIILINGAVLPSDRNNQLARLGSLQVSAVIYDETNQIEYFFYEIMNTRIRFIPPSMANIDYVFKSIAITNPDINSWLYSYFWQPYVKGELPDYMAVIHSTLEENPHLSEAYKKRMRNLKEPQRSRLYLGKWVGQSNQQLIEPRQLNNLFKPLNKDLFKPTHISADIARMGDDKTVYIVWSNLTVVDIITKSKQDTQQTVNDLKALLKKYNLPNHKLICDKDNIGSVVTDFIRGSVGIHNNAVPINRENYQNIKTQLYYKFAELVDDISIICDLATQEQIKKEFNAIQRIISDGDDKFKITSKKDIRASINASPDYCDALVYGLYFKLQNNVGEWYIY